MVCALCTRSPTGNYRSGRNGLDFPNVYRIPEESVNPRVKNYHWGDFTQGIFEAKDNKYETVILLDFDGNVTEGPGFNVFAVKDGVLITPDRGILAGVSRKQF